MLPFVKISSLLVKEPGRFMAATHSWVLVMSDYLYYLAQSIFHNGFETCSRLEQLCRHCYAVSTKSLFPLVRSLFSRWYAVSTKSLFSLVR